MLRGTEEERNGIRLKEIEDKLKPSKKPVTLYLDALTSEMLNTYCYMSSKNKTRVMNEAIYEFLTVALMEECKKEGLIA